jgi:tetratricopeptide (TPR) repeat protein
VKSSVLRGLLPILIACLSVTSCHRERTVTAEHEAAEQAMRKTVSTISSGSASVFLPPAFLSYVAPGHSFQLPSPEEARAACGNLGSFYRLNRARHFDTIFLAHGSFCAPLRDELLQSPLWVLSDILPEGYLFRPVGSPSWKAPSLKEITEMESDPAKRSLRLSSIAENLIAIGHNEDAAALMELAAGCKSGESRRLAVLASLEASRGHWNRAGELARSSLAIERANRTARIILIRALDESGKTDEALEEANALVRSSQDAETLFLLARAANAAGDHAGEISALRRLVSTGKKNNQPVGASLLYLGQALGQDGQRGEALRALDEAEQSPELTPEQKNLVRQLRDHLAPEKEGE